MGSVTYYHLYIGSGEQGRAPDLGFVFVNVWFVFPKGQFQQDMGFWGKFNSGNEGPYPGVSFFYRDNGKIFKKTGDHFGPGDMYCSPWHFFDLLKNGVNDWQPKFKY